MMLQSIDKGKIYFYFFLLVALVSIHNLSLKNSIDNYFKIKKIVLKNDVGEEFNYDISSSLSEFYKRNIFSIDYKEFENNLGNFNIIDEYKIKKEYPSTLKIEIKKTNVLAYYLNENNKIYIGENGKKIDQISLIDKNLPIVIGKVDIKQFLELNKKLLKYNFSLNEFSKIYFFKSNRWDLLYKDKITIKLPINNLDKSLDDLKELMKNLDIDDFQIIDLRIKNKIIFT